MSDDDKILNRLRDAIQEDIGCRGLRADPHDNLIDATLQDFAAACRSIAEMPEPRLAIVTGFTIPGTDPLMSETDGPLGALFLARATGRWVRERKRNSMCPVLLPSPAGTCPGEPSVALSIGGALPEPA